MNVDLPWKGTSGYNKNRLCCVPLAMNTAVFIICGKDFADDQTEHWDLSTEPWKHFRQLYRNRPQPKKMEDEIYEHYSAKKQSLNYFVFLTIATTLTSTNRECSLKLYFYNNFYSGSECICLTQGCSLPVIFLVCSNIPHGSHSSDSNGVTTFLCCVFYWF